MNRFSAAPQFRPDRLTLAEPGAEGGSGGGGPAEPQGRIPQLSQAVARQEMENRLESPDPNSGGEGTKPKDEGKPGEEAPPAGVKPDSETATDGKPKAEGETSGEEPTDPEKRVDHAKAKMHAATTKAAQLERENETLRKELSDAKTKVDLANKYVDWDKLTTYDKEQMEVELGRPLTRKDLQELKGMATGTPPAEEPAKEAGKTADGEPSQADVDKFVEKFLTDNPHVLPYVDTGEAQGVVAKISAAVEKEHADKTPLERLTELGKRVGDFFRKRDAEKEKEFADRLTTKRTALEQGGSPRASGGAPPTAGGDDAADDPATYIAERQAQRARTLNVGR